MEAATEEDNSLSASTKKPDASFGHSSSASEPSQQKLFTAFRGVTGEETSSSALLTGEDVVEDASVELGLRDRITGI